MGGEPKTRRDVASRIHQLRDSLVFFGQLDLANEIESLLESFHCGQASRGHLGDLPHLLEQFRNRGLNLDCQLDSWPIDLNDHVSQMAYEIVGEALQNALKHGNGQPVRLKVCQTESHLRLEVRNRSRKPSSTSRGLGMGQLRWRVRSCRGQMKLDQRAENEVRLRVQIPLQS